MTDLLPARMLNEMSYCPRLFALEHVMGDWADSGDTVEGRTVHRRVDRATQVVLESPEEDLERPRAVRSVELSDPGLQLIARIDLVEASGRIAVPVDYKKGRAPNLPEGAWEPERVQVCAQALLLRAHGYEVPYGVLYFAGSKKRVRVELDEALILRTLTLRDEALELVRTQRLPPPLVRSPKCQGCSLVGICLPDETNLLREGVDTPQRDLVPARDDGIPLHVVAMGGKLVMKGDELVATDRQGAELGRARLEETSQVVVHGNVTVTTPLLHELAARDIPVAYHGYGGRYQGTFHPASGRNVPLRHRQHLAAADPAVTLSVARAFVEAKVRNQRTLLRRNARGLPNEVLIGLQDSVHQAARAPDLDTLRGVEGYAARLYFEHFPRMLSEGWGSQFEFEGRNRRPPKDPINALLSFAYAMLAREYAQVIHRSGMDPYVGFLHTMRHNRPALALDLMEELRPVVADSVVLTAINNGVLKLVDFRQSVAGCALTDNGRRKFLVVFERRMDEMITHPLFRSRWSYRRTLEVQVRLLGKTLMGEFDQYPGFVVR